MPPVFLSDLRLNARLDGPASAPPVVFVNALGTDLSIWDPVIARLPGIRALRYDARGHGASDVPAAPYSMGQLIHDCERLMDHFGLKEAVIVGLSVGGLVAQGLAVKRMDLIRAMVLSNTAARIGSADQWAARIALVQAQGLQAIADATMERWFGRQWRTVPQMPALRQMLLECPVQGWAGTAAAIAGTDFYTPTAALRLPTLAIAGANDGSTPPDLVRETADLIAGHRFHLIRGAGHLPFVEAPDAYAAALSGFFKEIGHV